MPLHRLRMKPVKRFGQRLYVACGVDLVLFKPWKVEIAIIVIIFNFHLITSYYMAHNSRHATSQSRSS